MKYKQNLCGIDEAGRGCLAGALVVSGVVFYDNVDIKNLNDSKKINAKNREALYEQIISNSIYKIIVLSNKDVDKYGLTLCIKNAILQIIKYFDKKSDKKCDKKISYLIDGNHCFGIDNLACKIKADSNIQQVMAASILSKVTKDRAMLKLHNNKTGKYKKYNFAKNKGYGTKEHKKAIKKYGLSDKHRISFKLK